MKTYVSILVFSLLSLAGLAQKAPLQDWKCSSFDSTKAVELLQKAQKANWSALPKGEIVGRLGKAFLRTPYVAHTLEVGKAEPLTVNLQGLDCTTFLEYITAMTLCISAEKADFGSFMATLEEIRYRNGKRDGYPSRLHYFSEWLSNNQEKGILSIVSEEVGGTTIEKKLDFMTTHRNSYSLLKDEEVFAEVTAMEKALGTSKIAYLPKAQIAKNASKIKQGDLIALATNLKGLDVVHVGFAFWKDGQLHLMHASTGSMQVEISEKPLADYMKDKKIQTGIMVARLADVEESN